MGTVLSSEPIAIPENEMTQTISIYPNPSEGIFTVFSREENYSPHLGVYVEIEVDGKVFPCIYEIHERGIRTVPLNIYLSPAFTSYVEVYRFKSEPES